MSEFIIIGVHGNVAQVQGDNIVRNDPRGDGRYIVGHPRSGHQVHVPLQVPTFSGKMSDFHLLARLGRDAKIVKMELSIGKSLIRSFDNLNLTGEIDELFGFDVNERPELGPGINISMLILFSGSGPDSDRFALIHSVDSQLVTTRVGALAASEEKPRYIPK